MNVYDAAHQLAKALKTSEEYMNFKQLNEKIVKEPKLKEMLDDFRKKQLELQAIQMSGKELDQSHMEQIQKLYEALIKDPRAAEYLQGEMRFSQLMGDIYKLIGEAIDMKDFMNS